MDIMMNRRLLMTATVLLAWSPALGVAGAAERPDLNLDAAGVMLHGYDPVAYFTDAAAIEGSPDLTAVHDGGTYRFASAEHRDMFAADPGRYVPAYGGFCAMGTVFEKKLDGDPRVWKVVDNRLFLNVNADVQKKWIADIPGNIASANDKWPKIRDVPADQLNAK
jgi:YHS domain-containing protein